MKNTIITSFLLLFLFVGLLDARHHRKKNVFKNIFKPLNSHVSKPAKKKVKVTKPSIVRVRTTAYTHTESDHLKYGRKNAIGTTLKFGQVRSAAADWSKYPVGTEFKIKGIDQTTFVIDDYGSALVGTGTIDLYKPSRKAMNRWGVRHVEVQVIKWGCKRQSLNILKPRTRYSSGVRKMVASLRSQNI